MNGKGPPRNTYVTNNADIVTSTSCSRLYIASTGPLNSVANPAISSCSASGMLNGLSIALACIDAITAINAIIINGI